MFNELRMKLLLHKSLRTHDSRLATLCTLFPIAIGIVLCTLNLSAQTDKKLIESGNKYYEQKNYDKAIENYSKASTMNPLRYEGQFNEGDALYKKGEYEKAAQKYATSGMLAKDKNQVASSLHNLGNSMLQLKKYEESIDIYKKALKYNPNDEETRYNLAYAQKMLQHQKNQQKQNKENQNKDQNKDQDKQKEKDKKEQKKDQNKQGNQDEQQKDDQKKEKQNSEPKMSKEKAEESLRAVQEQENKVQENLRRGVKLEHKRIEKDW